jgi:purine catabolism regulator
LVGREVRPSARRDELLVTTGYALRENPEQLGALVRELHRRGVAALGVKLGRYLDEMPRSAVEAGDELGFPVVALPATTSYDELLTAVLTAVLDHQAQRLTRSEDLHRALVQVVLGGGGLPEVASALAAIVDVEVLLTDSEGVVVVRVPGPDTGTGPDDEVELPSTGLPSPPFDSRGRLTSDAMRRGRHASEPADSGYAVVPIIAGAQDHGRIVAISTARSLGDADLQSLERAATVCALAITKQQAVTAVESKYQADFLRDVLLGRAGGPERTVPHARTLGWDLDRRLVVVVVEPDPQPSAEAASVDAAAADAVLRLQLERLAAGWAGVVRRRDPAAAVVGFTTEVVAVLAVPDTVDPERLVRDLAGSVASESRVTFSVGLSRAIPDASRLPTAYEESRRALAVGRQVQGPGAIASFERLGVHRLLSLVPDAAELRSFERETLAELADDSAEAADLRHTLQVLLDTNLNVAQAARALHFHYNTLRYRIAKLERMLGPFTTDPLLRLDLALALRVVQMRGIPR